MHASSALSGIPRLGFVFALTLLVFDGSLRSESMPVHKLEDKGMDITRYMAVGPFEEKNGENAYDVDYLKRLGLSETIANPERLTSVQSRMVEGVIIDFQNAFERPRIENLRRSIVYACFVIQSERACDAWMLCGASDSPVVHVNGKKVFSDTASRGLYIYDYAIPLPLRKGANLVMIKVPRKRITWNLSVYISPSCEDATFIALKRQSTHERYLLQKNIYATGEAVVIEPKGVPEPGKLTGFVRRWNGEKVGVLADGRIEWRNRGGNEGLMQAVVCAGGVEYHETFLIGEPDIVLEEFIGRLRAMGKNSEQRLHFEALALRLVVLKEDRRRTVADGIPHRGWHRKVAQELLAAQRAMEAQTHGQNPFGHVPGLHVRGFQSAIDDSARYYRIYVPTCYERRKERLPLVVLLPTAISTNRPFIQSPFMNFRDEAERMAALAETRKVILLWSGYRSPPTGSPMEAAHLEEVLTAVARDYEYDSNRVLLMGACSGGAMALNACAYLPSRFAGIGLLNPVFSLHRGLPESVVAGFNRNKNFRAWHAGKMPDDIFRQASIPGIFIINDGGEPGHGEWHESVGFAQKAKAAGGSVLLERREQTYAQHFGAWDELLAWLVGRPPVGNEREAGKIQRNNETATIQEAMSRRFVIVQGTGGSESENEAIAAVVEKVRKSWEEFCHSSCHVVTDRDLTEVDRVGSVLVLVGNDKLNLMWKQMVMAKVPLPIQLSSKGATVRGQFWSGLSIGVQMVMPNPANPEFPIVFVGSNDWTENCFGTFNLARDGWYGLAIWRREATALRLIEAK
jgi:hypothetical protein